MALNPFFLQGAQSEQRLIQDLINEQLTIFGVEVTYIPRKYVEKSTIIEEVRSSKFDDNFSLEAYVNTYEGYSGAGDVLTKFGVSLRDEVVLTVSKERFEDFISPFLSVMPSDEVEVISRPREGDLVYFPLGQRLFEVKFVEHEKPFYQLGKLYVYELQCELFEYEDEIFDTSIDELDEVLADEGYVTTITLRKETQVHTAVLTATRTFNAGYIQKLILNDDGSGYTSTPTVAISTSPVGLTTANAEAVAITTSTGGVYSISELLLTRPGFGYTEVPTVTISGGGGVGAAATALIGTGSTGGISEVTISDILPGSGYVTAPNLVIENSPIGTSIANAEIISNITNGVVTSVSFRNAGYGYTDTPSIIVDPPIKTETAGVGTYKFNEIVIGSASSTRARVKEWDINTMKLKVGIATGQFLPNEDIIGEESGARYNAYSYEEYSSDSPYEKNEEFETEGISILDFSEDNPFGTF